MDQIDKLALLWQIAKNKEDAAKAERIKVEEDILKLHPAREEGTETFLTSGGTKVKLTGKVTYKANVDQLIALTGAWPDDIKPYKIKTEADESKLKAICSERPDLWRVIAGAVDTKPAKTGVSIEFKGQ